MHSGAEIASPAGSWLPCSTLPRSTDCDGSLGARALEVTKRGKRHLLRACAPESKNCAQQASGVCEERPTCLEIRSSQTASVHVDTQISRRSVTVVPSRHECLARDPPVQHESGALGPNGRDEGIRGNFLKTCTGCSRGLTIVSDLTGRRGGHGTPKEHFCEANDPHDAGETPENSEVCDVTCGLRSCPPDCRLSETTAGSSSSQGRDGHQLLKHHLSLTPPAMSGSPTASAPATEEHPGTLTSSWRWRWPWTTSGSHCDSRTRNTHPRSAWSTQNGFRGFRPRYLIAA